MTAALEAASTMFFTSFYISTAKIPHKNKLSKLFGTFFSQKKKNNTIFPKHKATLRRKLAGHITTPPPQPAGSTRHAVTSRRVEISEETTRPSLTRAYTVFGFCFRCLRKSTQSTIFQQITIGSKWKQSEKGHRNAPRHSALPRFIPSAPPTKAMKTPDGAEAGGSNREALLPQRHIENQGIAKTGKRTASTCFRSQSNENQPHN